MSDQKHYLKTTLKKNCLVFLRKHRGVIEPNEKGHLIIDGKTISTDPHDASKLVHYLTKDISGKPPKGVKELLQAMSKRGFDYKNNLGNAHLKKMLDENKKNMSSVGATTIKRSTSPTTSSARKVEILNKRYSEKKKAIRQRRAMKNDVDNNVERSRIVEKKAKKKEDKEEREGEASKKKSKKKKVITSPTRKSPVQTRSLTKNKNV